MRIYATLIGAIVAVAACDGGGGSTGTTSGGSTSQEPAGSPGQEDAYCKAAASHDTCNGGTSTEPCREDAKCIYGRLMSRTAANAYFDCYSAPSCKSDDTCAGTAGQAVAGPAAETYTKDCTAKVDACAGVGGDFCSPAIFAYPNVRDAAQACLSKTCAELEACFKAAVQPISDCK